MTDTTPPLSHAAQAVRDALKKFWSDKGVRNTFTSPVDDALAAAALRAAADAVVPHKDAERSPCREHCVIGSAAVRIRAELLAIAAELEGQR